MRILVTARMEESGVEALREYGEVLYEPYRQTHRVFAGDMLVEKLDGIDILVTEGDHLTADVIEKLTTLQVICDCRGTPVNVDIPAATKRGIPVLNTPGRNADAVADLTVCLMIMLARHVPNVMRLMRDRTADSHPLQMMMQIFLKFEGVELWRKTVGIIGLGVVGRAVAARLRPFGANLVAYDPYLDQGVFDALGVRPVDLETLLCESHFVTLHAKVTPETIGMLGADQFAMMKPTAYFVNLARAVLTDEDALADALREKRIAGAALDVFTKEPPPVDHPLLQLDNVIALPHIGGTTAEVAVHQTRIAVPDIARVIRGQKPLHCVNPETLDSFKLRT